MTELSLKITPEAMNAMLAKMVPRATEMGVRFVELREGFVRATVPLEGNGNHLGTVYAGAIFAVAEILGGGMHFASFDGRAYYPVLRGISLDFKAPGRGPLSASASLTEAELAQVKSDAEQTGKGRFTLTAEVKGEDGTLVATARGDYQIRRHGS